MSCIITYKGQKYSEEQFKEYFINNKQEFATSIAKNKDVIDSFKRKMEGIDFVFSQSPELASIGSKAQYLKYLSTIFKTSKVKDIVYHTNNQGRIEFGTRGEKGLFVTPTWELAKTYKSGPYGKRFQLLINSNNVLELSELELMKGLKRGNEDTQKYSEEDYTEYVVFEPEQIHILGNKQDIEGFKEFVSGEPITKKTISKKINDIDNYKGTGISKEEWNTLSTKEKEVLLWQKKNCK